MPHTATTQNMPINIHPRCSLNTCLLFIILLIRHYSIFRHLSRTSSTDQVLFIAYRESVWRGLIHRNGLSFRTPPGSNGSVHRGVHSSQRAFFQKLTGGKDSTASHTYLDPCTFFQLSRLSIRCLYRVRKLHWPLPLPDLLAKQLQKKGYKHRCYSNRALCS